MTDVSARDLRNHTAAILRRAEAGERLRVTVSRRAVAELGPVEPAGAAWIPGAAVERLLAEAPADRGLLAELAPLREQTIQRP